MTGFWSEILRRLIGDEIDTSVALLKIHSAVVYLHVIRNVRRLTRLACLLVLFVVVLACGFLLIPVSLCLFMPWAPETKAIVAAAFGAAYILVPVIAVAVLFRERLWMKVSRVDTLIKEVLK